MEFIVRVLLFFFLAPAIVEAQIICTIAGNGRYSYTGDGGAATVAGMNRPASLTVDTTGNIYISDYGNHVIRKIYVSGIISTFAGTGTAGYSGDGGPATAANINQAGVTIDPNGNLVISDWLNHRIRIVNTSGIISTIVGTGTSGFRGDGGPASAAQLSGPDNVAFDHSGNMYIADHWNNRIRKVDISGVISTFAGNGSSGYSGDGGAATAAEFYWPTGVCIDYVGNVYFPDAWHEVIRKVSPSGIISTFAGNGTRGYSGDGGAATAATLWGPANVIADSIGNVYISDYDNSCIRKVDTAGFISTFAGNGTSGFSGDGGPATSAELSYPQAVAISSCGNFYIADEENNRIRKITYSALYPTDTPSISIIASPSDTVCTGTTVIYTATYTHGGSYATYQWYINTTAITGATTSTYTYTPANGDSIKCIVTTWNRCSSNSYATSNVIHMVVDPSVTPTISISPVPNDTVCAGTSVTYTATIPVVAHLLLTSGA